MLMYVTSLNPSGLRDWFIQRVSAVLIGVYALIILGFLATHPQLTFVQWQRFFMHPWLQIYTLFVLFSILMHTWIGMWTVSTDYMTKPCVRITFQLFLIFALLACLFAGIMIVWGS